MGKKQKIFFLDEKTVKLLENEAKKRKIPQTQLVDKLIKTYIKIDELVENEIEEFKKMVPEEDIWKFLDEGLNHKQIAERTWKHPEAARICLIEFLEKWYEEEKKRLKSKFNRLWVQIEAD